MTPTTRNAALDGLRGLAALAVVTYHAWLYSLPRVTASHRESAFDIGVHELRLGLVMFFVLSGFLLFRPWVASALEDRRGPALVPYLMRRGARILPAYYIALLGALVLVWPIAGTPGVRLPPGEDLWLFFLFGQNFKEATLLKLDPPMWTLTIEATFYLALPVLGWLALRMRGRGRAAHLVVPAAFLALGVAWNWWIAGRDVPLTFTKILPAMAPYFALGMATAVLVHGRELGRRAAALAIAAGCVLALGDATWHAIEAQRGSHNELLHIIRDLPGAIGFAAIIGAVAASAAPRRFLAWRPVAYTGEISYGIYLWHVPLMVFARSKGLLPDPTFFALAVALPPTLLIAGASWHWLEHPMIERTRKRIARRRASDEAARRERDAADDRFGRQPSPGRAGARDAGAAAPSAAGR